MRSAKYISVSVEFSLDEIRCVVGVHFRVPTIDVNGPRISRREMRRGLRILHRPFHRIETLAGIAAMRDISECGIDQDRTRRANAGVGLLIKFRIVVGLARCRPPVIMNDKRVGVVTRLCVCDDFLRQERYVRVLISRCQLVDPCLDNDLLHRI